MGARRIQLKLVLTLLVYPAVLGGCAHQSHQYLIRFSNGHEVISYSKPKPQGDSYEITNQRGVRHVIQKNQVVKIKTVTVISEETKPLPAPKPKAPKHWYFLWLA